MRNHLLLKSSIPIHLKNRETGIAAGNGAIGILHWMPADPAG